MVTPILVTYYYPHVMAAVFLAVFFSTSIPGKARFFWRALAALVIATILVHLNRWFDWWPAHRFFASGHMTFCYGVAISLGMLRPWTLLVTLPLLVPFGAALVVLGFHNIWDVLGAVVIVSAIYAIIHWYWRVPLAPAPLDIPEPSR